MSLCYKFTVAGHTFGIEMPDDIPADKILLPYQPFSVKDNGGTEPIFIMRVDKNDVFPWDEYPGELLYKSESFPYIGIYRCKENYVFGFSMSSDEVDYFLSVSTSFREARLYIGCKYTFDQIRTVLNSSMMLLYALNTADKGTLIVHAAAVELNKSAYIFLGLSGTGKSTHARLWRENVAGSELLNDDTPVLRVEDDGSVFVYGSPWSGKTPCYKNRRAELGAFIRLSQAPFNRIRALKPVEAYASLRSSSSCMKWVKEMADGVHSSVERIVERTGAYYLECLPDNEAALLCAKTVKAI